MRFAMVLALAGSALLYSGCTKDYQKDIDDLNSGVTTLQGSVQKLQEQVSALEALKSQIASLQGDVAPLQAAIDKNTEAIKKLQEGGYVTKDELDAELASLRDDTELALDALAELVADNVDAIDALKEAYEKTDAVAKALNLGKIASVALVRYYDDTAPTTFVTLNAWKLVDAPGAATSLYETTALLNLDYQVSPASLAASLNEDNVALSIYSPKKKDYIKVPVTITEIDEEAGIVSLYANLFSSANKSNFNVFPAAGKYYTPFALVVNDTPVDGGVVNDIKSQYDFAEVDNGLGATELTYYAKVDNIEVPYDKFASSERKFFDGIEFKLKNTSGTTKYMSLDEAAGIFGVDVAVITPTFKKALAITDDNALTVPAGATGTKKGGDFIKSDKNAWTAAMKATKLDDAKTALSWKANITATATAYITKGGITKNVWSKTQKYSVVNAEGTDITIGGARIPWEGIATVAANKTLNREPSKKITDVVSLYRTYKDNNGAPLYNEVKVDPDGNLVNVTPYATNPGTAGAPAGTFAAIPYTDKEQNLEFTGVWTNNNVDYPVSMTLTIGAKPADKKNLDLGTFRVDGSYTKDVNVDLSGIIAKLIGNDEDLFDDVPTTTLAASGAALTENPLYAAFAEHLYLNGGALAPVANPGEGGTPIQAKSVIIETDETSTDVTAATLANYKFTFKVPQDNTNGDKGEDKSFLTLPLPTENGETYVVGFEFTAFDVNYEGNLKVEIAETGNFYLKTTGLVGSDNVIPVTWHATANEDAVNPTIAIDEVDFAKYLVLNKDLKNEDAATLDLKVEVVLEGAKGTYTNNGQKYVYDGFFKDGSSTYTSTATNKITIPVAVDKTTGANIYYKKELKSENTSKLVWNTFSGDQIKAKATLYYDYANTKEKVGETIELTLKRANQVKKMEVNTEKLTVGFTPGSEVTINLDDILKLTSVINSTPLSGKGQLYVAATTDPITGDPIPEKPLIYNFKSHSLVFGLVDSANKFTAFTNGGTCSLGFTTSAGGSGDFTATYDEDITTAGSEKYTLTIPTTSLDVDYTVKFKVGLDLANIPDGAADNEYSPHTAEYAVDVELKLVRQ